MYKANEAIYQKFDRVSVRRFYVNELCFRFFQNYGENNCDVECRIRQMIRLCGCLPYNYRLSSSSKYAICNFTKIDCLVSNYCESRNV